MCGVVKASTKKSPSFHLVYQLPVVGMGQLFGEVDMVTGGGGVLELYRPGLYASTGGLQCVSARWETVGQLAHLVYQLNGVPLQATVRVAPVAGGLSLTVDADQAVVAALELGALNASLGAVSVPVPYYSQSLWWLPQQRVFLNAWWDWHQTNAAMIVGGSVQYLPRTDGSRNLMHEQLVVLASPNVDAVLPSSGNAASPYMAVLAGRTVLDIWDEGFAGIGQQLAELNSYGVGDCVGIVHNWQHAGYDNQLPLHYTANPQLGGDAELKSALAQGAANGCLMAVHENYVDYYANYPQFDGQAVALNSDGSRQNSWLNAATGVQAYTAKPTLMVHNAATQSPQIHASYGTTADYLDVHSGVDPTAHRDQDASQPGSGRMVNWMQGNQALWAYERKTHHGPVLGEGMHHWYYSGQLDGVEAQTGAGAVPTNSDASLALFVDFDLMKIHPLQVNHGMGYYDRWSSNASTTLDTTQMDAYRMQEVIFGHAPFLSQSYWADPYHAMSESGLVGPVSASYGTAQASQIQYQINGQWVNSSTAAASGEFSRVQVGYNNGLTVVANATAAPMNWKGHTLPQYGWLAQSSQLLAYTALCGTTMCDYAQTPTMIFANARNQTDAQIGSGYARPSVVAVAPGHQGFSISYQWQVMRNFSNTVNYVAFVHFLNDSTGEIVFQGDHALSTPTSLWQADQSIADGPIAVAVPNSVPDGTYSVHLGIYDPSSGMRLPLVGTNDSNNRYLLGSITITGHGAQIRFTPNPAPDPDPRLNANGNEVDFGTLKTDGLVLLKHTANQWELYVFPRTRNVAISLNKSTFQIPAVVYAHNKNYINSTQIITSQNEWKIITNGASKYVWSTLKIKRYVKHKE
jgi:hypothetical protein